MLLEQSSGTDTTRVLIDTSPDMREQMLDANVSALDGVWYTHEHADHTHGIDELRVFFLTQKKRIPVWADEATAAMLKNRFGYCFTSPAGSDYPPILSHMPMQAGQNVETVGAGGSLSGLPFKVHHGNIDALGFRVGNVAYSPDVNGIPVESLAALAGLDVWIIDALRRKPHPSHFSLPETLHWIERIKPKQAIITNLHVDLDYDTLSQELPPHIRPAFDGMVVEITHATN